MNKEKKKRKRIFFFWFGKSQTLLENSQININWQSGSQHLHTFLLLNW